MQLTNDDALNLVRQGYDALQQGQSAHARNLLEQVTATGRANAQIWLLLATACRAENDEAAEEAALDNLLALEPHLVRGQILKGDCRARAGDERAALSFYEIALLNAAQQNVAHDLKPEISRAGAFVAQARDRAAAQREDKLATFGLPPDQRSDRFQQSVDILAGRKEIFVQQPTAYYFPGLPQIQYFERADFEWVPVVESATSSIQAELDTLLADEQAGFRPYFTHDSNSARRDDNHLIDNADWSTRFLCENGLRDEEMIARCPATWKAMQAAPMPNMASTPTVMFSLLRPGARIAAHTGMFNTRLICHLPLVVPPGCGFRVGNEIREWEIGKLIIFDDTIEHEAWNNSDSDRVVLIFDIWRPDLTEQERREVTALFS